MDHIFLPRKLNLVKLRKCQCMEIRLTSYWSRKKGYEMVLKVSKVEERKFFQINNEIVEIKDYKIKSSADGSTELLIVIEGNVNVFETSANLTT